MKSRNRTNQDIQTDSQQQTGGYQTDILRKSLTSLVITVMVLLLIFNWKVGLASQGTGEGQKASTVKRWAEWQEAEAPKGVGSEALADHVHVIDAGPGVAAAVRNARQRYWTCSLYLSHPSTTKGEESGAKRPWKAQHPWRKDLSFINTEKGSHILYIYIYI